MASGGQVRIGLDAFAARLLGPMDRIDLPLMGKPFKRDHGGYPHERRGALNADLLSPVSGVVTAFNPDRAQPQPGTPCRRTLTGKVGC
jgi:glycine cleavage system H lipoate-binding protein